MRPARTPVTGPRSTATGPGCWPARFTLNNKLLSLKFEDSSFVLEEVEESA